MYDLIQATLTNLIQFTAIAGMTGIIANAMWRQHTSFMDTYCPPIAPYTPDTQAEIEAQKEPEADIEVDTEVDTPLESPDIPPQLETIVEDAWETPIASSPARYWMRPAQSVEPTLLALPPAKEEAVVNQPKPEEIELANLDVPALRKLCDRHQIAWRHARGKNRHMNKQVMIFQLQRRLSTAKHA